MPCEAEIPCVFCLAYFLPRYGAAVQFYKEMPDFCQDRPYDEMRRYLYRNVTCECPSGSVHLHMPDVPGWS